jgi:flagellar L-ring protein precursor FlgH
VKKRNGTRGRARGMSAAAWGAGIALGVAGNAGSAEAQSLFQRPAEPQSTLPGRTPDQNAGSSKALIRVSLTAVTPAQPRTYQKNDMVQILINESSVQKFESTLDTQKDYNSATKIGALPSIRHLLEMQLRQGDTDPLLDTSSTGKNKFKGDGTYERTDKFVTKISARVLEVKPNGTLVIEAKKITESDDEKVTLVVSGTARPEDITNANTVQSTQLADLVIKTQSDGEVRKAAKKGLIPRVLDTIFNY